MLKQHKYYVYHDAEVVMARADKRESVIVQTCATPQEAADAVQAVVNPTNVKHFDIGPKGFLEDSFQASISENCKDTVIAAYLAAGITL